jgi:hypothetical protein
MVRPRSPAAFSCFNRSISGGLKRSTQHFILNGKDGVYGDETKISSRVHCGRESGVVGSLASRANLNSFRNYQARRARQCLALKLPPSGPSKPFVGLLFAVRLALAGHDQEFSRYEGCGRWLGVSRISPEIYEQKPCTRLHRRSRLSH